MLKVSIYNEHGATIDQSAFSNFAEFLWQNEGGVDAEINIIFVGHDLIKKLNKQFFNKNSTTDVIAFPLGDDNEAHSFSGEVYVCIDQVHDNSKFYDTPSLDELKRVVAHGLLHLLGYRDKTSAESHKMREKEDYYLELRKKSTIGT